LQKTISNQTSIKIEGGSSTIPEMEVGSSEPKCLALANAR